MQNTGLVVKINEASCVGCTKCIQACPVDAILGAALTMHTVIAEQCIGCQLCIPVCPVDCIDIIPEHTFNEPREQRVIHAKERQQHRKSRLAKAEEYKKAADLQMLNNSQSIIQQALARAQNKKSGVIA